MKCEHCGSADIVAIQGQNYCLKCGHIVTAAAKPAVKGRAKGGAGKPVASSADPSAYERSARPAAVTRSRFRQSKPLRTHPLRFSLTVAAGMALIVAVAAGLVLWLRIESDIAVCVVAAAAVGWIITSVLSQSALIYGLSRAQDGRAVPHQYWWVAARGAFLEVVNVNIIALIKLTFLAAVAAAVWHIARNDLQLAAALRVVLLVAINAVLVWAALGVYVVRRLAIPAVVVGNVTAWEGVRVGWQLYLRGGGHLVAAGLEAMLGRLVAVAGLGVAVYAIAAAGGGSPNQTALIIGGTVAVALGVFDLAFVMLEWESRIWLRQYRRWVTTFGPAERVRLLTGRVQPRPPS